MRTTLVLTIFCRDTCRCADARARLLYTKHAFDPNPVPFSACCELLPAATTVPPVVTTAATAASMQARREPITVGILTVSDRASQGVYKDLSGPAVVASLPTHAFTVVRTAIVPDDKGVIAATLEAWSESCRVILTTGGTGIGPRDVTPEATARVIARALPGVAEAMRRETLAVEPLALLSRAVCGVSRNGRAIVANLPGSPAGAVQCVSVLLPLLPRLVDLVAPERVAAS